MNQGTYPLAAAMINQLNRVDKISNNLANANTTGFKQEGLSEGSFNHYLEKTLQENKKPVEINKVTNSVPKIDGKYTDASLGAIVQSGNKTDFALKIQDTFFKVKNDNGEILLTRDGNFGVINGILVNKNGYPVMDNDNNPIATDDGAFGTMVAVVKTDFNNLDKIGNNNYRIKEQEQVDNILDNEEFVVQGALEKSNVNSITSMISLIDAHRRFAQSQKAIEGIGEIGKSLVEKLGKPV